MATPSQNILQQKNPEHPFLDAVGLTWDVALLQELVTPFGAVGGCQGVTFLHGCHFL